MLQQAIGGAEGEMRVALQYVFQAFAVPAEKQEIRQFLMETTTEELGHIEMLATAVSKNLQDASDEARERWETLIKYVGPLDLIVEEIDPEPGSHLGNYPQAFNHIGLINSALYMGFAERREMPGPEPMGVKLGTHL